ncbi:Penicillin-binding protein activator LpoB [Candidatus Moranella endobia PCVAL]|uniref:Penicillin-binding protein activator LpoB n=1 Tax=Moranella endobia (strain PCIT) TaxID=903503 RepID=F7XX82_MOREP|nr:penicillin-binding protein activator LpoB [Candidatus Moranella endobia]AEI74708.1 uncharacterized lipoprotein [Candidatus Moranella endobia PCIT]AGJ61364.1 Penicillin-binding protein activator LpoB [Candidatus Moranella endobia PCVAL]
MNKIVLIAALVLTSCTNRYPNMPQANIDPATQLLIQLPPAVTNNQVTTPKIKTIDWQASMLPIVQQMLLVEGINYGSVIMINNMKNVTNGSVQTGLATATLTSLIAQNCGKKFQIVCAEKLNAVRKMLGLSSDDSFDSRSKAAGIARYLNAHYVLYSAASGNVKEPTLDLQLIEVPTGEIIWSGRNVTHNSYS